jgi:hypothetical protein
LDKRSQRVASESEEVESEAQLDIGPSLKKD